MRTGVLADMSWAGRRAAHRGDARRERMAVGRSEWLENACGRYRAASRLGANGEHTLSIPEYAIFGALVIGSAS
jgi:hypothetical protein